MSEVTDPAPLRPVTPVTKLAALLASAIDGLHALPHVPSGLLSDLKQAHALAAGLEPYVSSCTSPVSASLQRLEQQTKAQDWLTRSDEAGATLEAEMLSGHVEGRFLAMLVAITHAVQVLEIGMFTGYSALAMAEALPDHGRVVACELDPATADFARTCFAASTAGERIQVEVGDAATTLRKLRAAEEQFDLIFIDADKGGYLDYLSVILGTEDDASLLAPGGLVCVDNTLLQGEPWAGDRSVNGAAIAEFNAAVAQDPRLEQVLLPLRDGLTLLRKL